jgi:hypothetical protein
MKSPDSIRNPQWPVRLGPAIRNELLTSLELLPYQSAFAANNSRIKIGLWARQTGKDHTATAEAVIDCLQHPGATWIILAASERQALESLAKAKDWADILKFRIDEYIESPANLPLRGSAGAPPACSFHSTLAEIRWSNGSRLLALPANPQTIRGYSANLILTEFAFHENPDAIWRAIYPSISNPLRGGRKKLRIISTPNGLTNKFADLWLNTQGSVPVSGAGFGVPPNTFSSSASPASSLVPSAKLLAPPRGEDTGEGCSALPYPSALPPLPSVQQSAIRNPQSAIYYKSKITVHDAIASGLPLDAAELQAGLNDPDAWSQEYLCEFMDTSAVMFPYDLIGPCESSEATQSGLPLTTHHSPLFFAGIDFGRKHHLTVCWILEALPSTSNFVARPSNLFMTREILCLKNTSTPDQIEILRPRLQRCRRICLDYTGAGVGLGDYLAREFNPHSAFRIPQSAFRNPVWSSANSPPP